MAVECTYCGADVYDHDPVFVETLAGDEGENEGERTQAGQFCNYACLSAHIDEAGLVEGACCHI